ncbi:MAG TPA: XRE family transcriptional regulator [Clostridia bacterium]|nr:XRE family transcriptional regulator [Clostridia bacterium]
MLTETLIEGLKPYTIGEKLRGLRLKKSMGLVELGKHTGLSAALISKLERGKLFPTLPTLLRIAMVFGVGLDYFFTEERQRHVVAIARKQERTRFPETPGTSDISYFFESLDFKATERKFGAYFAQFEPVAHRKAKPHQHAGVEFVYVIAGKLAIKIGSDEHELRAGDAIYFDSTVLHSYRRAGNRPCNGVVITMAS